MDSDICLVVGRPIRSPIHSPLTQFVLDIHSQANYVCILMQQDNAQVTTEPQCRTFHGPWIRWSVVRRNTIDGISEAARNTTTNATQLPPCGQIVQSNVNEGFPSTDIVLEANSVHCPAGGQLPGGNTTVLTACDHCIAEER